MSKPYQRASAVTLTDDEPKEQKIGPKKGQTYQLIAHDGVRFLKLVLMFGQQSGFIASLREKNKWLVKKGTSISRPDRSVVLLVMAQSDLSEHWTDKKSARLQESYFDIKGLPIKYTDAPKFKFINSTRAANKNQTGVVE